MGAVRGDTVSVRHRPTPNPSPEGEGLRRSALLPNYAVVVAAPRCPTLARQRITTPCRTSPFTNVDEPPHKRFPGLNFLNIRDTPPPATRPHHTRATP